MALALLQNTQGLHYDSSVGVCQKFPTVPFPTTGPANTIRSASLSGSSSRANYIVAWSCWNSSSGPTQDRWLSMSSGKWASGTTLAVECCLQNLTSPTWLRASFLWKEGKMRNICILFWKGDSGMSLTPWVSKNFTEAVNPWIFMGLVSYLLEYMWFTKASSIIINLGLS